MIIKILCFISNSVPDSWISKKILSEICRHDIWNLNVGSIRNFGMFANKSPQFLFIKRDTHAKYSSLIKYGDHEMVENLYLESFENVGSFFEIFIVFFFLFMNWSFLWLLKSHRLRRIPFIKGRSFWIFTQFTWASWCSGW